MGPPPAEAVSEPQSRGLEAEGGQLESSSYSRPSKAIKASQWLIRNPFRVLVRTRWQACNGKTSVESSRIA